MHKNCLQDKCRHGGIYNPNSHCQRYCTGCAMWFHVGCLGRFDGEPNLKRVLGHDIQSTVPEQFLKFIQIPIERGGLSGLVGNGQSQFWARSRIGMDDVIPPDWNLQVSQEYLKRCEGVKLVYFHCPTCDRVIWQNVHCPFDIQYLEIFVIVM